MSLNKTIIKKVHSKTSNNLEIRDYLIRLLEFESEPRGWFKKSYLEILEKSCKEDDNCANNEY